MSKTQPLYNPILKQNNVGFYIEYYVPHPIISTRHKQVVKRFDLNQINDSDARARKALNYCNQIRSEFGQKIVTIDVLNERKLIEAINRTVEIMCASTEKEKSQTTIVDMSRCFIRFLEVRKWEGLRCKDLEMHHVQDYFDYLLTEYKIPKGARIGKKISNATYNGRKNNLRWIFSNLTKRGYIETNFFTKISSLKVNDPTRRPFSDLELKLVMDTVFEKDEVLTFAVLCVLYCGLRPGSVDKLKGEYFDFKNNLIRVPGRDTKRNRTETRHTIPAELLGWFRHFLERVPKGFYVLGAGIGLEPNAAKHCGKHAIYNRFRKILCDLEKINKITKINLTYYSLRDNCAYLYIEKGIDIEALMRQLAHKRVETTQRYWKNKERANEKIKEVQLDFVPKIKEKEVVNEGNQLENQLFW